MMHLINFQPNRSIFVGDLSYFCQEEHLISFFQQVGPVTRAKIARGVTGKPLHYAFVEFLTPEAAKRSYAELNGQEFMARFVR